MIVIIDEDGNVKKRHKDFTDCVDLGEPADLMIDSGGRILICDYKHDQVLVIKSGWEEIFVVMPPEHVINPFSLCLDTDNNRLYVSGKDGSMRHTLFVYDYEALMNGEPFSESINKIHLEIQM